MPTFTLDTNCFIAIDDGREESQYVMALAKQEKHEVALLASSASERQLGGSHLESFDEFTTRMKKMEIGHLKTILPIAKWGLCFWGFAIYATAEQCERETLIFQTLFPTFPASWQEYAKDQGIDGDDLQHGKAWKWRNRLCDAQAFWSHEHAGYDIFVTTDKNFRKKLVGHAAFPGAVVMTPKEAVATL